MNTLNLRTYVVNKDKNEIIKMLCEMSDIDWDFNGENGVEYLWESLQGTEFENNRDYVLSVALKETNLKSIIETFVVMWLENDKNYYTEYNLTIEEVDNKLFIAVAFITEY